jgi:hypothetical protein
MRIAGTITLPKQRPPLFRVLHDKELRKVMAEQNIPSDQLPVRPNLPEVHPFYPNHHSPFDRPWQLLSKMLNSRITTFKWRVIYWYKLWITNHQGFDKPDDPRVDFVNMRDIGAERPRVEALTTGGSLLTGYYDGPDFVVQGLNVYGAVPTVEYMWEHPWYLTYAVSVDSFMNPRRFPQGMQPDGSIVPIVHPLIVNSREYQRLTLPKWKVEPWTNDEYPDPYTIYRL